LDDFGLTTFPVETGKGVIDLKKICDFLGLDANEEYLNACANIVFKKPRKTRKNAPWTPELIKEVEERMKGIPFLEGYSYYD